LSLWLTLTIAWFAAHVLAHVAPQAAARMLTQYARDAGVLLVVRALKQIIPPAARRSHLPQDIRRLTCRAVAGARLRRALHTGTLIERARAIADAVTNPERWVAHIVRRMQRRFTRMRRLPAPIRTPARAIAPTLRAASAINSS
jgi:hypothetical protein